MSRTSTDDPLLTFEQAKDYLNETERWLRRAVAERRIRYTKTGHHLRFRQSWLDDYLRENERGPAVVVMRSRKRRRTKVAA